jgi:prepilin-type N-terminal cleavage/methylation domain-containing protein
MNCRLPKQYRERPSDKGFSMLELVVVMTLVVALAAFTVPVVQSTLQNIRLRNAAISVAMAIQATRFQAIRNGYPFAIEFDPDTNTYQVYRRPTGTAGFAPFGGPVPLANGGVLRARTRLEFMPSGMVNATVGSLVLTVAHGSDAKSVVVSRAGRVQIQ